MRGRAGATGVEVTAHAALGVDATKQKRRVLFTRAADLARQSIEAHDPSIYPAAEKLAALPTHHF